MWPEVLPAIAWRGHLLSGFHRSSGDSLDLSESAFVDVMKAVYPELGLSELARLLARLQSALPDVYLEFREPLCSAYSLRWNERLQQTFEVLLATPPEFQAWSDEKKLGARDLAALLALPQTSEFSGFLSAMVRLPLSKAEGVRVLELGVELYLLGRPLSDLLPSGDNPGLYLRRLEQWRRPRSGASDESWRETVSQWPWPSQVQGQWQRFGDQAGLEIKIRATSPDDLMKKLERLNSIGETWSCKS